MQVSKKFTIVSLYMTLLGTVLVLIWLNQSSLNHYWEQTYHQESPLKRYLPYAWFEEGRTVNRYLTQSLARFIPENTTVYDFDRENTQTSHVLKKIIKPRQLSPQKTAMPTVIAKEPVDDVVISPQDQVFFAGDSLMQAIAPHIQKYLRENFNMRTVNLSQQSTGLSYPHFFDWPKTIEDTLNQNPHIKLLVILLGANDPWNFPNPAHKHGPYLKFHSQEWQHVYESRIERILNAAKKHNVKVLWLGIPYMRNPTLNQEMRYLDEVIKNQVTAYGIFLPIKEVLVDPGEHKYQLAIQYRGKLTRVRLKDGVHFTWLGQKIMANYVLEHIHIQESK
ncbi:hypothetical protein A6A19_02900 [Actinobacillus delphinicola]|uniref:SGNH/GDSL hydrolase family protein n=1 Tax=Actinobacillus delphinicola TaxID=51161 RepID=UPI002442E053|nr:DUF459 domain-containing protein [Actinobacillus delphinicola]MDG6896973.1 hypothetical protein [Actinobacillus delphinicola]